MTFIGNDVIWCQIDVCSDSRNSLTLRRFGRDVSPDDDDDKLRSKRPTEESFKMLLWWKTFGDVDSDVVNVNNDVCLYEIVLAAWLDHRHHRKINFQKNGFTKFFDSVHCRCPSSLAYRGASVISLCGAPPTNKNFRLKFCPFFVVETRLIIFHFLQRALIPRL